VTFGLLTVAEVNTPVESLWSTGQKSKPPRRYQSSTYEPLISPRRSLRLLSLFPGSPNNPEIDCELIMYDFDENAGPVSEKYEVLTCCWGTAKTSAYINIRKGPKLYAKYVPPDLVHALHSLRKPQRNRFLWIDAKFPSGNDA
jgi:hypothetical protein